MLYVYKLYNLSVRIVPLEIRYLRYQRRAAPCADHPDRQRTDGDDAAALGGDDRLASPRRCGATTVPWVLLPR